MTPQAEVGMTAMAAEIAEAPRVAARFLADNADAVEALGRRLRNKPPAVIVTGARGSSDNAVAYFKYLVEILLGVPVASIGPSVASVYGATMQLRDAVLVCVSQSGQSPDLVALQQAARRGGAPSVVIVNDPESELARGADVIIDIAAGVERSVAATKTCIASAVALAAFVAAWSGDRGLAEGLARLPDALAQAATLDWDAALPPLAAASSAYVLGRGPALPIAAEAALKLKETSVLHAEAFSGAEVLHGPLQLLTAEFPVLAFRPNDAAARAMDDTIRRIEEAGGRVFSAGREAVGAGALPAAPTGHWALDPLPMLLTFYRFAEALSRLRGHDPDRPAHLSKVTRTV